MKIIRLNADEALWRNAMLPATLAVPAAAGA